MSLSATFDWPPKALSPNARIHWAKKAKAVKGYRKDCHILAMMQKLAVDWEGPIHLFIVLIPPSKRRYDMDNALAALKSGLDGVADALEVNDSRFRIHAAMGLSTPPGRVSITVSRDA